MIAPLGSPFARRLIGGGAVIIALALVILRIWEAGVEHGRKPAAADRDRWRTTAGVYLRSAQAWEASYRLDARLRGQEAAQAVAAITQAAQACDARIAAARKSAAAIQSIVTRETVYDPSHCPVRRSVGGAERLRDAVGIGPSG